MSYLIGFIVLWYLVAMAGIVFIVIGLALFKLVWHRDDGGME